MTEWVESWWLCITVILRNLFGQVTFFVGFPDIWELYAKRASEYELPHLAGSGLQASQ